MDSILQVFSTREVAVAIWLLVFVVFILCSSKIRGSVNSVIIAFFKVEVITILLLSIIYTALIAFILRKLNLWDYSFLKDTILWFVFSFCSVIFNLNQARNFSFFKNIFIDSVKNIVFVEFFANLHTFPLWLELMVIPIVSMTIIMLTQINIKKDLSNVKVASCLNRMLIWFGIGIFVFATYKTIINYDTFVSLTMLKMFVLPISLTILSLPYFYILALYMEYSNLFSNIGRLCRFDAPIIIATLKRSTLIFANINIIKLKRVQRVIALFDSKKYAPHCYIKLAAQKRKSIIGSNAKLALFNDVNQIIRLLSKTGLGKLNSWMRMGDFYHSSTEFYEFDTSSNGITKNRIQHLLSGERDYVYQVAIHLNVGYKQDSAEALSNFCNVVLKTFAVMTMDIPDEIIRMLKSFESCCIELDKYSVLLECNSNENIKWCSLCVNTKLYDESSSSIINWM